MSAEKESELHEATRAGDLKRVEGLLLGRGWFRKAADPNTTDASGRTSLHYAAAVGNNELVGLLLNAGARVDAKDAQQNTALTLACSQGHTDLAKQLLERGADVNIRNHIGSTPLHSAVVWGKAAIVELLLQRGADVNATDQLGQPLHMAATCGHEKLVRLLLEKGASVNSKESKGNSTPLHLAVQEGRLSVAELLLNLGADLSAKDGRSLDPLTVAAVSGQERCVDLLISKGAEINARDAEGRTPLLLSIIAGQNKAAVLLLAKGADPNLQYRNKSTALHFAAHLGMVDVIKVLLSCESDIHATDSAGLRAMDVANGAGHKEAAGLLKALTRFPASGLKQTYRFRKYFARLYELSYHQPPPPGAIVYKFVLVVMPRDPAGSRMFIASETTADAMESGAPPFICVYQGWLGQGSGHVNYGSSAEWGDLEKFAIKARQLVCSLLEETETSS